MAISAETRRKMSEAKKRNWADKEYRERQSRSIHISHQKEEYRKKASEAALRPEAKKKREEGLKRYFDNPETRQQFIDKLTEVRSTPEYKAMQSAAIKKYYAETPGAHEKSSEARRKLWENEEYRELACRRIKESSNDPEVKARKSAAVKAAMQRPEVQANWRAAITSPEHRAKHVEIMKRQWESPGYRERVTASINEANKRPEVKAIRSAAMKKVWEGDEARKEKSRKTLAEVTSRPGYRERVSKGLKKYYEDPKNREKISERTKEYNRQHPELSEAISKRMTEYFSHPENRAKVSEAIKKAHQDPEKHKRMCDGMYRPEVVAKRVEFAKRNIKQNTSIELKVQGQLKELGIDFVTQKHWRRPDSSRYFFSDIYIEPLNLVIECNGDYWHTLEYKQQRDDIFQDTLDQLGVNLLWVWEHDIKRDDFDILLYLLDYLPEFDWENEMHTEGAHECS